LIEGFRAALIGKKTGDSFRVKIKSDDGYGPYDYSKVKEISKENMPGDVEVNQVLVARAEDSEVRVLVKEVRDDVVVIDGNHPLAGIDLVYDVDIVEVH
jgi:FKBP-type peptidyl-prolyl cis-trans isomerase SlyD